MIEKEKIIAFVNYNVQPLRKKQLFSRFLVIWVISVPCALYGSYALFTTFLFGILNCIFTIYSIKLLLSKSISSKEQNAFVGIHFTYVSIVLLFSSYKCAVYNKSGNLLFLLMLIILYLLVVFTINLMVYRNIKRGIYLKELPNNKNIAAFSFAGSIAATIFSRIFLKTTKQTLVYKNLSIILFILALLTGICSLILQKYYWQRKLNLEDNTEDGL